MDVILKQLQSLAYEQKTSLLQQLFTDVCRSQNLSVENDFLDLLIVSMRRLKDVGRRNVVYDLVRGIGTTREDGSGPRFPVDRMPMGMLEYVVKFNAEENTSKVSY